MSVPAWVINSGALIHKVTIQEPVEDKNTTGEIELGWRNVATVYANVKPLRGRELWQAQQVRPNVTHLVEMRYFAALTPRHRFLFRGCEGNESRILNIDSVINVEERNIKHEVSATEEVSRGV